MIKNSDTDYLIKRLKDLEEHYIKAEKENVNLSYGFYMSFPKVYAEIYEELKSRNVKYKSIFIDEGGTL